MALGGRCGRDVGGRARQRRARAAPGGETNHSNPLLAQATGLEVSKLVAAPAVESKGCHKTQATKQRFGI